MKAEGRLIAAGPQHPRYGGLILLRVPDEDPEAALDDIRNRDPFYTANIVHYELLAWNVVIGKEDLDGIQ